ncbi:MAG: DUF2085 domain-containing protein [Actinobacteria bacterium]|nr:DUF2085 domain-containing protein [Actinomycetota bacterium]
MIYIMDQVGFAVCHQLPERSFQYGGRCLPVCARDAGLFLAIAVCLTVLFIVYRNKTCTYPSPFKIAVLGCFILPMLLDVLTVSAGFRNTSNVIRLATGALAGTGIAALIFPIVANTFHEKTENIVILGRWWHIAFLSLVPAGIFTAMQFELSYAYWIWAPAITAAIIFTFFVLSYTFINLAVEWRGGSIRPWFSFSMVLYTGLVTTAELVLFNRLHWFVNKLF